MYLLLCDETNTAQSDSVTFFIYGAVIIPMDKAAEVADGVTNIRQAAGYPAGAEFKFDTRSRPEHVPKENFAQAKSAILALADATGVRFMACVVHHKIADRLAPGQRPLFALKTLLCEYDLFLKRKGTSGICSVDRFDTAHSILSTIRAAGVDPAGPIGRFQRDLSNIWMYSVTSISCSHLCSLCDIVIGAFRYCVNSAPPSEVARRIYPSVRRLFLHPTGKPEIIENWGLLLRPKAVKVKAYANAYTELRAHLAALEAPPTHAPLADKSQPPTAHEEARTP